MKDLISAIGCCAVCFACGFLVGMAVFAEKKEVQEEKELSEWAIMQLAIMRTESDFNPLAIGRHGDWGILQITPTYVKEVNRLSGEEKFSHEDAFDIDKSLDMFNTMNIKKNPQKDIGKAISLHNPNPEYAVKVRRNMEWVKQYEKLRNQLQ